MNKGDNMNKRVIVLCGMLFSGYLFGSLELLKQDFDDGIKRVEAIVLSKKQDAKEAIQNLMNLRQEARKEIQEKSITRTEINPQLQKSRKVILTKTAQLLGIKEPKRFRKKLRLKGFKKLSKTDKVKMLTDKANELLDKQISEGGQNDLVLLFNLQEQIIIFGDNNKEFLLENPELSRGLADLSEKISSKLVAQGVEDVGAEEPSIPSPPPLPPRDRVPPSLPSSEQVEVIEESFIPTPPPLPPRDRVYEDVIVEEPLIPTPPPLPPRPPKEPDLSSKKAELMEEIRKGKELKPTPEAVEKEKGWLQEIKEGIKLKPVEERQIPDKPQKEETVFDEIKKGVKLKPASERELSEKSEREKTDREKLREEIREGIKLRPVSKEEQTSPPLPPREEIITEPTSTPLSSQPSSLLEAIRERKELKPVAEREVSEKEKTYKDIIADKLEQRRTAIEREDEEEVDDEDWD